MAPKIRGQKLSKINGNVGIIDIPLNCFFEQLNEETYGKQVGPA